MIKQAYYSIMEFLVTTYLGGFFFILLGIIIVRYTIRNPDKKGYPINGDIKGWFSGIGFILLGTIVLIFKLLKM